MGQFVRGDIVVLPIPYSDLSQTKRRPALVALSQPSNTRPNRLFTAEETVILYRAAHVTSGKLQESVDRAIEILRGPTPATIPTGVEEE